MNKEDLLELIEKEISGRLTAGERKRLESYLEKDPEARELRRQMVETGEVLKVLKQVQDVDVPPGLKNRIMDSIDPGRYRVGEQAPAATPIWRHIFRPRFRVVYAFALGIVVGLVFYSQTLTDRPGTRPMDVRHLYGTIAGGTDDEFREIEAVLVDLPEVKGAIKLLRVANFLVVESDLDSDGPLEVVLSFDPDVMHFQGFGSPDSLDIRVVSKDGALTVAGTGHRSYILSFAGRDGRLAALGVGVAVSGEPVYEYEFSVPTGD